MNDKRLAWLLGLVAFLLLAPGAFFGLPHGKIVVGAARILAGEVPYRDFWTMYAPGAHYLVAGLFALLGRELFVQALAACALAAAASSALFLLLRDAGASPRLAGLGAILLALARWHTGIELSGYEPALFLALLAWRDVLARRFVRAGLLLGIAAVFKHDFAAYAAVGAAMAIAIRRENPLPLLASALAIVAPGALLLAWRAGPDAWRDLVLFPATGFPAVRGEPYPHLVPRTEALAAWAAHPASPAEARGALLALGRFVACFAPELFLLAGLAIAIRRGRGTPPALVLALALLPLYWLAAHVQQNTHVLTMAALSMLVLAVAWSSRALPRWALGPAFAFHALGLLVGPAVALVETARGIPGAEVLEVPGAALVMVPRETHAVLRPLAAFVRQNVPTDEPIYVGLDRHDATVISSPILYYLCDRAPAVRYHELHPGVTDREEVQAEMLGWIEGRGTRCAILWRFGWPPERLDAIRDRNRRAVPGSGSTLLDEWLREHFAVAAVYGEQAIAWRSD
jgi:hypothetical protein